MKNRTNITTTLFFKISLTLLLAVCAFSDAQSQSFWESAKRKASSAWNKTKEIAHSVNESEMLQSVQYKVPVTNRSFYNFIPDSYINQLGASQYKKYMASSGRSTSTRQTQQVNRVAKRLIRATEQIMSDCGKSQEIDDFDWEINLVCNQSANAFCMPGGKIVVYDGILRYATDDASLACVMGHEIAHALAKHSSEQITKTLISTAGIAVLYAIISNSDMSSGRKKIAALMAAAGITLANLKFSRTNETEADRLGLILAAAAGYDPNAAIGFWQRMGNASKQKSSRDWYSTHPSNSNRISNIRSFLPEAKEYYHKR